MKEYYIRISTYGEPLPHIIDEEGINYLNPDEFMFLCEADCMSDAKEQYMEEFSRMANDMMCERFHP